jgi:hypothetical protein
MKTLVLALAALLSSTAATAATPYVEATASTSRAKIESTIRGDRIDLRNDLTYGGRAGLDFGNVTADVGVENFLNGSDELTLNANLGVDLPLGNSPLTAYAQGGVLQTSGETGYRLGGGLKLGLTQHSYIRAGYQRDDYGQGAADAGVVGLGLRF